MIRQYSKCCKLVCKNRKATDSRTKISSVLTDQNLSSIDRNTYLNNQKFKCLGFQTYFTKYIKETVRHVSNDFGATYLRFKRFGSFSFQNHYQKSIYIQSEPRDLKLLQTSHQRCWI